MTLAPPISPIDEGLDFLASTPTPEQIIAFRPSAAMAQRIHDLLTLNRDGLLDRSGQAELDYFIQVEHFMRLLKAKAHEKF